MKVEDWNGHSIRFVERSGEALGFVPAALRDEVQRRLAAA
jgi:hypothetical protein